MHVCMCMYKFCESKTLPSCLLVLIPIFHWYAHLLNSLPSCLLVLKPIFHWYAHLLIILTSWLSPDDVSAESYTTAKYIVFSVKGFNSILDICLCVVYIY